MESGIVPKNDQKSRKHLVNSEDQICKDTDRTFQFAFTQMQCCDVCEFVYVGRNHAFYGDDLPEIEVLI